MKISFVYAQDLRPDMVIVSGVMDGDLTVLEVKPVRKNYIEVIVRTESLTEEKRVYTKDANVPVLPKTNGR